MILYILLDFLLYKTFWEHWASNLDFYLFSTVYFRKKNIF